MKKLLLLISTLVLLYIHTLFGQTDVYLVLGSDTGIWDGASTSTFQCYYGHELYTDPSKNAYGVMDPAYRDALTDSYGQTLKLTWWMHGGNMFRNSANNNFPLNNTMSLYLIKQYHGQAIEEFGDELTLHYHTWKWTDYDGDGRYWWNQAKTFAECRDDFDVTLAQYVIEEEVFPVSFRSGWHYMDNGWQHYLNELLPYSLHNAFPAKKTFDEEPTDNIIDWSLSPRDFVPYHPSDENYQIPGISKGWNVGSKHIGNISQTFMDTLFARADRGISQVACLWGHLPENDFLENLTLINERAHQSEVNYPGVKFQYLTAIEAMQKWLKNTDPDQPEVEITENQTADHISWSIRTNEPIFQRIPFIAVKNIYNQYRILECQPTAENEWETIGNVDRKHLAKMGLALTDTVGNLTIHTINYLPDDLFLDNLDPEYTELAGDWVSTELEAWGTDARMATVNHSDSAIIRWKLPVHEEGFYNIFNQFAPVGSLIDTFEARIIKNGTHIKSKTISGPFESREWIFLENVWLNPADETELELAVTGNSVGTFAPDGLKISALIPERGLDVLNRFVQLGEVCLEDTIEFKIRLQNAGIEDLKIKNISTSSDNIILPLSKTFTISPFEKKEIEFTFHSDNPGIFQDSIFILSDDPVNPERSILLNADVQDYFVLIDNEDSESYSESGDWKTSVAQAYGTSSRYVFLKDGLNSYARFDCQLEKSGIYDVLEIVPKTENSSDNALYELSISGIAIDSVYLDQNVGSSNWCKIGSYYLPEDLPVSVRVINNGGYTTGPVLRADAIKFQLVQELTDIPDDTKWNTVNEYRLFQNYPNPFNAVTTISFQLPEAGLVTIDIYDVLGRKIGTLLNSYRTPGLHKLNFDANAYASGIYYYLLKSKNFQKSCKMILIK